MQTSEHELIERLQQRNADRARATDGGAHPRKLFRPTATRQLQVAERAIGFKLPALLRAIYLRVASGGFGPQYGIVGIKGGAKLDGSTLESCYGQMVKLER